MKENTADAKSLLEREGRKAAARAASHSGISVDSKNNTSEKSQEKYTLPQKVDSGKPIDAKDEFKASREFDEKHIKAVVAADFHLKMAFAIMGNDTFYSPLKYELKKVKHIVQAMLVRTHKRRTCWATSQTL